MKKIFFTIFAALIALTQFSLVSAAPHLSYRAYVQDNGWMREVSDGDVAGTTGQNKRLEALVINLDDDRRSAVEYCAHVQSEGWQSWRTSGDIAGTMQRSLRMEAVKIQLTGRYSERYDIYYRVHVEGRGWLDWVRNGEVAGAKINELKQFKSGWQKNTAALTEMTATTTTVPGMIMMMTTTEEDLTADLAADTNINLHTNKKWRRSKPPPLFYSNSATAESPKIFLIRSLAFCLISSLM